MSRTRSGYRPIEPSGNVRLSLFHGDDDQDEPREAGSESCPPERLDEQVLDHSDDLVLLVHGTFAGDEEDAGHRWWQQGSAAYQELERRLPLGARLPRQGELFHWSGDNSERDRIKAGHELLERMWQLEQAGRGYHLIGHSHGGSVIWHALRLATLRRRPLERLKSWTTVGTPFLHYRTRGALSLANIANVIVALFLLMPAYRVFVGFFGLAFAAVTGSNTTLDLRSDAEVGWTMSLVRAPLLKLVEWAGVPVMTTETGMRIGSYDPASGESLREYLFWSWEGLVVTSVILAGGYFFLMLASLFLNPVLESLRIRAEKKLECKAMECYRGRWLGLWSDNDEAINGLRATLDLSVSFVTQITPRERILLSDYLALISQPYLTLIAPAFNHFIRPGLDRLVRSFVVKAAQGNNRPAAEVVAVSPFPVAERTRDAHPSLPPDLSERLLQRANEHARDIAPQLRELLSQPSFVAGLERFGHALSGRELIHTSYFDHAPILDLLALHVAWARDPDRPLVAPTPAHEPLAEWFRDFKRSVREAVSLRTTGSRPLDAQSNRGPLIQPRRASGRDRRAA